jgi:hypothetical protein
MTPMLAHAGHVLFDLGVYGSPVLLLAGGLALTTVFARHEEDDA